MARSLWAPSPRQLVRLLLGLWVFGTGEGLVTHANLGNSPWTVLAEGVSVHSPLTIGSATVAISFVVLLLWIPLRVWPGMGTVLNAILVGVALDVTFEAMPHTEGVARALEMLGGIALVGVGSGLYINAALGPGPRDGLMTGLHARTGHPIALVRAAIELSVFALGAILGGTWGIGTAAFALLIGPAVATALRLLPEASEDRHERDVPQDRRSYESG